MKIRAWPAAILCSLVACSSLRAEVVVEGATARFDGAAISRDESCRIQGVVKSTDSMDLRFSSGRAILTGLRINGRTSQDDVEFHLIPPDKSGEFPGMKKGQWYEVTGRWRDVKLRGVRKVFTFQVVALKMMKPVRLQFADFEGRVAVFTGMAMKGGRLRCGGESAALEDVKAWPQGVTGKELEVRGILKRSDNGWMFAAPSWHLVKLADQLGEEVSLEGSLWSLNGVWWFDYRGTKLCLTGEKGPVLEFETNLHGVTARVTGRLVRQLRPSLDQISLKGDLDLVQTYVIRAAKVDVREKPPSAEERFRPVYADPILLEDGVPVLVAESSFRRNLLGNETHASLYAERNAPALDAFLKAPGPPQIEVLARRLASTKNAALRLLYAAMLAACNDVRGRIALLDALKDRKAESFPDALYCMGAFPFLLPKDSALKTESAWAEEPLAALLKERLQPEVTSWALYPREASEEDLTVAQACVKYSAIIDVLLRGKAGPARAAVVEFALSGAAGSEEAVKALCRDDAPLPLDVLTKFAGHPTEENPNRHVLQKMLRQKEPAAVHLFRDALDASFVFSDFREALSPEIVRAFAAELPTLRGDAFNVAELLLVCQEKDAAAELIKLLENPARTDRSGVVWELARLNDPRALPVFARALRRAADGFFKSDSEITTGAAITNSMEGIANIGGDAAISELISLLTVKFGRAESDYLNDAGLHRIIAAHLINLTGESFGVDAKAWRKWFESRK